MGLKSIAEIDESIGQAEIAAIECDERNYHRMSLNNPYRKHIKALKIARQLVEAGCDIEWHNSGIEVNGKYVVATQKNKWRPKGRGTWYFYSNIPDLVEKYFNKPKEYYEDDLSWY